MISLIQSILNSETENRMVVARVWEDVEIWNCSMGIKFQLYNMNNFQRSVVQQCTCNTCGFIGNQKYYKN